MNAKALSIAAILLVILSVAFGVGFYLANGREESSSESSDDSFAPVNEWSAEILVEDEYNQPYNATVYSSMQLDSNGSVASWEFQCQVTYESNGTIFRHQYNQRKFLGYMYNTTSEAWELLSCLEFDNIPLDEWKETYTIQPVTLSDKATDDPSSHAAEALTCAGCTSWQITVGQLSFVLIVDQAQMPHALYGAYGYRAQVLDFTAGGAQVMFEPSAVPPSGYPCQAEDPSTIDLDEAPSKGNCAFELDTETNPCRHVACMDTPLADADACENYTRSYCADNVGDRGCHAFFQADYYNTTYFSNETMDGMDMDVGGRRLQQYSYCAASWLGDGWCDACHNNELSRWDGGDCCQGSCTAGRAYPCGIAGFNCKQPSTTPECIPGKPLGHPKACKKCIFLHGLGNKVDYLTHLTRVCDASCAKSITVGRTCFCLWYNNLDETANSQYVQNSGFFTTDVRGYWGDIGNHLAGKCEPIYNSHDTVNRGWDDPDIQLVYYAAAKQIYDAGGAVFAHSMGNLILAGACKYQGLCDVKWWMVQGPLRGSKIANLGDTTVCVCLGVTVFGSCWGTQSCGRVGKILGTVGRSDTLGNQCNQWHDGLKSCTTYHTGEDLSKFVAQRGLLKGGLCGTSGWGSGGLFGAEMVAINAVVYGFNSDADGALHANECRQYLDHYDSQCRSVCTFWWFGCHTECTQTPVYYQHPNLQMFAGNHFDGTGYNGNHAGIIDWYKTKL
eukprot:TRINITY_DN2436_c0_g1::TRINITY_DN2436_c0_g1_i1::g.8887::m.8887 TRINITY_DN2436_c0_g1::TRINITY_DN2436_c0_g1_i1::g.8887  ORF type:complete len:728 (-),score=200.44,Notch/PF00066.12/4e+02,Notch/PF00066.12/7.3e-05,Notch/PF00066.12/1.9e+03,Notch/PF00066.12/1.5e+04 TRINITY_DN2436_c0_g1_i1:576-2759(-)